MSSLPMLIAEWPKNTHEVVRIELTEFRGNAIVGVRTWFRTEGGELRPSKAGIAMSVRHLPALADGIAAALDRAQELRLIDG